MNSIAEYSVIGMPAMIVIGFAWIINRIKHKKEVKFRELELNLQLDNKLD